MKKVLFVLLLASTIHANSQVNAVFKKFCFDAPFKTSKFEVRAKIHASDNFSNINDYTQSISAVFKYHPYIDNISKTEGANIQFQFDDKGTSMLRHVNIYYRADQASDCIKQYEAIVKLFKPYTKKSEPKSSFDGNTGEKAGKGIMIYPTTGAEFFLADVAYMYQQSNNTYRLTVTIFDYNIWK